IESAWAEMIHDDEGEEILWALRACMGKLAPRAQQALKMRYGQELGRERIAEELDLSQDGVKSLLQRSRAWLRECIERRADDQSAQEG
ncbi:MAG: sigma-70 family RNA polymerase sigma factor, partial [Planctomycetes bacterium]|nr:sigma-70 family RNA polymerase sigma factor [Planctomycetota bacterium]